MTIVTDTDSMWDCDIIITTTPSESPVLHSCKTGALVVAVGADTPGKRELGPAVVKSACVVCDSRVQCLKFGEMAHACAEKLVRCVSTYVIMYVLHVGVVCLCGFLAAAEKLV